MPETHAPPISHDLRGVLASGGLRAVFQPIVDLRHGTVVGYEALARGPVGSALERPDQLFAAAAADCAVVELDWACRGAALAAAADADLDATTLFVNVEPEALGTRCPDAIAPLWETAAQRGDVVLELTERALTARPAELLREVQRLRDAGWGIALDDIGADTRSLALLPLVAPDVVKLDLRLIQQQPTREVAAIVNAVRAHRERTGSHVVAEGIETEAHRGIALAMGATLGQGWLFGRPEPLPDAADRSTDAPIRLKSLARIVPPTRLPGTTPFEVVRRHRQVERASKRLLLAMSQQLEDQAEALGHDVVIISAFQTAERFTPATRRRYAHLAERAALVGALGVGLSNEAVPGLRGAQILPDDQLAGEWSVAVVGHHFAGALVARDLGDTGAEDDRRFDFAVTYDRELVVHAAATLVRRLAPVD